MARKASSSKDGKNAAETTMGDIRTAAKSTMADADYRHGYPPIPGRVANVNYSGKSPNVGGKK